MNEPATQERDFAELRRSESAAGTTLTIGTAFVNARTRVATFLVRMGVRPNHMTGAGFVATVLAAACCLIGAGHHAPYERVIAGVGQSFWPLWAAGFLILAGACDMLDGAVARVGSSGSRFGGVLDSTLDRASDIALYLAICVHFAYHGNVTYAALAVAAMCNGYMISYVKARAEEYVEDCSVGFWLRGERVAGLLLSCLFFHVPAWLWVQAIAPFFTVLRRIGHTYAALRREDGERRGDATATVSERADASAPRAAPAGVLRRVLAGHCPRGSAAYDIITFATIAFLLITPWICPFFYGGSDPLRQLLGPLLGH